MSVETIEQQAEAAQEAAETATEAQATESDASSQDGGDEHAASEDLDFEVIGFADERVPTDEELLGKEAGAEEDEGEKEPDKSGAKESETPPPADEKGKGEEAEKDTGDEEQAEAKDDAKPPKGYVPTEALREERTKRQHLAAELDSLKAEIADLKAGTRQDNAQHPKGQPERVEIPEDLREDVAAFEKAYPDLADVVRLDTPEGRDLRKTIAEYGHDDPITASLAHAVGGKLQYQRANDAAMRRNAEAAQRQASAFIDTCLNQMEEAVPELFEEGSKAFDEMLDTAETLGLDRTAVSTLTDPRVVVALPDGKGGYRRALLGAGAVSVVKLLANAHKAHTESGETISKAEHEKLIAEAREAAAAEAIQKIKKPGQTFKSLARTPGAGGDKPTAGSGQVLSEAELEKLTPAELDAYERGEL